MYPLKPGTRTLKPIIKENLEMNMETLRDSLPGFAKDTKLNLGVVLTTDGALDLSQNQIYGVALSVAYS